MVELKCFAVDLRFTEEWFGEHPCVIIAISEEDVRNILTASSKDSGIPIEIQKIKEIPMQRGAHVIW